VRAKVVLGCPFSAVVPLAPSVMQVPLLTERLSLLTKVVGDRLKVKMLPPILLFLEVVTF